jgi:hypothetical protein
VLSKMEVQGVCNGIACVYVRTSGRMSHCLSAHAACLMETWLCTLIWTQCGFTGVDYKFVGRYLTTACNICIHE